MLIEPVKIDESGLSEEILENVTCLNNAIESFNSEKKPNFSDFLPIVEHFHEVLKDIVENQKGVSPEEVFGAPVNDILKGFKRQLPIIGQGFTHVQDIRETLKHIKEIELLGQNLAAASPAPAPSTKPSP